MSYFDMALLAMVNHTKLPLRLATLSGIGISFLSFMVALNYLYKCRENIFTPLFVIPSLYFL
jgi:hypothetical protein